jgi:hypothetical protein
VRHESAGARMARGLHWCWPGGCNQLVTGLWGAHGCGRPPLGPPARHTSTKPPAPHARARPAGLHSAPGGTCLGGRVRQSRHQAARACALSWSGAGRTRARVVSHGAACWGGGCTLWVCTALLDGPTAGAAVWCAGCCVLCVGVRAHGGCMCHAQGGPGLELAEAACRVSGKGLDGSAWLRPFGLRGGVEGAWRCPVLPPSARGPLGARSVGCGHRRWVPPRPESSFEALRAAWVGGAGSPPLACYGARCGGWLRARAARG